MFSITLNDAVVKSLKKSDAKLRKKVHEVIKVLSEEPVPAKHYEVLKLKGFDGYY